MPVSDSLASYSSPWQRIVYMVGVAAWSIAWGVGASVIYCRHRLENYVTVKSLDPIVRNLYNPKTDWLDNDRLENR